MKVFFIVFTWKARKHSKIYDLKRSDLKSNDDVAPTEFLSWTSYQSILSLGFLAFKINAL